MDHGWDEAARRARATQAEHERFREKGGAIAPDPEVERRDRERERERREATNQSPWSIGAAFHDQRDLYTANASIESEGYRRGPSTHPEEGSYAYRRLGHSGAPRRAQDPAGLYAREAWPWLNYKPAPDLEPRPSRWRRLRDRLARILQYKYNAHPRPHRSDARIAEDARAALAYRGDLDTRDVLLRVASAVVTLEGSVRDRWSRNVAGDVVRGVLGVARVRNRLATRPEDPTDTAPEFSLPFAAMGAVA